MLILKNGLTLVATFAVALLVSGCQKTPVQQASKAETTLQAHQVKTYLQQHPRFTSAFFKNWQQKQALLQTQQQQTQAQQALQNLANNSLLPVLGNPQADVSLTVFFTYRAQSPVLSQLKQLLAQDKNLKIILAPIAMEKHSEALTKLALQQPNAEALSQFHQIVLQTKSMQGFKPRVKALSAEINMKRQQDYKTLQKQALESVSTLNLNKLPSYVLQFGKPNQKQAIFKITGQTSLHYLSGLINKYRETEKARLAKLPRNPAAEISAPQVEAHAVFQMANFTS